MSLPFGTCHVPCGLVRMIGFAGLLFWPFFAAPSGRRCDTGAAPRDSTCNSAGAELGNQWSRDMGTWQLGSRESILYAES